MTWQRTPRLPAVRPAWHVLAPQQLATELIDRPSCLDGLDAGLQVRITSRPGWAQRIGGASFPEALASLQFRNASFQLDFRDRPAITWYAGNVKGEPLRGFDLGPKVSGRDVLER